ncbi:hypothetical protein BJ741DRAFT_439078 [Chytriomyces cf. hyalinus JEL632]|nr:hypothetical protein BJ741DRAFT_439078 [Chytriomyces cf. hyalinus JEL632]
MERHVDSHESYGMGKLSARGAALGINTNDIPHIHGTQMGRRLSASGDALGINAGISKGPIYFVIQFSFTKKNHKQAPRSTKKTLKLFIPKKHSLPCSLSRPKHPPLPVFVQADVVLILHVALCCHPPILLSSPAWSSPSQVPTPYNFTITTTGTSWILDTGRNGYWICEVSGGI